MTEKIHKSLYGGKVEIDFYPNSHRYKKEGEKTYLISVTSATGMLDKSRVLISWAIKLARSFMLSYFEESKIDKFTSAELIPVIGEACRQHEIKKEKAASIGSQVHQFAEDFASNKSKDVKDYLIFEDKESNNKVTRGIEAFIDWTERYKVGFISSERLVYSMEDDYVGITDFVGEVEIDGKRMTVVGDYKTGSGIYNEHRYQLSAYWNALEEETKKKLDAGLIIHFDKETGKVDHKIIEKSEHKENLEAFFGLLAVKRREKVLTAEYYANR